MQAFWNFQSPKGGRLWKFSVWKVSANSKTFCTILFSLAKLYTRWLGALLLTRPETEIGREKCNQCGNNLVSRTCLKYLIAPQCTKNGIQRCLNLQSCARNAILADDPWQLLLPGCWIIKDNRSGVWIYRGYILDWLILQLSHMGPEDPSNRKKDPKNPF